MSGTSIGNRIISNVFDPVGIQLSASAGVTLFDNSLFKSNILANGVMNSIKVVGDNCTIRDNRIENVSGDAFLVEGNNNTFTNNTVYNFTGDVFRINGTNNRFFRNNVTYIIVLHNTTFNPNVSTPQVPIQYAGFVLESNANLTNISHNYVTAVNPSGLLNGIWGVRTAGVTFSNTVNNNSFTNLRTGVWIKDATQSGIMLNTLTNCVQRGIVVQNSQGTSVSNNTIIAPSLAASTDPYDASAGIYVYRHDDGYFADNNVSFYNIGLYLNNASNNTFERNVIKGPAVGRGVGIFSLYGQNNNFSQFVIYNQNIGVKLLYSNSSNFTGVNSTTGTTYGYQFFGSHDNIVQSSTITLGKTVNIEFSHFSANNVVNTCTLGVATDVDILYDLFATTNTGVGNGGPTQRQENGAAGNNIV
jgi:parallel beta-helix repeat protein